MPLPGTTAHARLTGPQRAVVDAIHADMGWVTSDYISNWTGLDKTTVRTTLLALHRDGVIRTAADGADNTIATYSCCGS